MNVQLKVNSTCTVIIGIVSGSTPLPSQMEVDWVKNYKRSACG